MDDNSHTLVYRRFFGILASTLPGLNLVLGLAALMLWVFADLVGMEWGWAIGIAAIILCFSFVGWLFVGVLIQQWAQDKSTGLLVAINAPFLLIDAVFMAWLFVHTVLGAHGPGTEPEGAETAIQLVQSLTVLV